MPPCQGGWPRRGRGVYLAEFSSSLFLKLDRILLNKPPGASRATPLNRGALADFQLKTSLGDFSSCNFFHQSLKIRPA